MQNRWMIGVLVLAGCGPLAHNGRTDSGLPLATPPSAVGAVTEPTATPHDATARAGAAELRNALGECQPLAGVAPFRTDKDQPASIHLCKTDGAIWWTSDLDIDCDGRDVAECRSDPDRQLDTALHDSHGQPLDPAQLPFVVIPGVSSNFDFRNAGLHLGSVVAVLFKDKVEYGIIGDIGPKAIIGEASFAMAQRLGLDPDPRHGGADSA